MEPSLPAAPLASEARSVAGSVEVNDVRDDRGPEGRKLGFRCTAKFSATIMGVNESPEHYLI